MPLNKPIKLPLLIVIIRSAFSEDGKFYPQLFFRWCFIWVSIKMLQYGKTDVSEGIDVNKTSASKESKFCHYCFF